MRKLIHVFVAVLWLLTTTGFSVTKHYCGGKYVKSSINSTPKSCCENSSCCHNESEVFQLHENTLFQASNTVVESPSIDLFDFENLFFQLDTDSELTSVYLDRIHIPPPNLPEHLALLQSFLL